MPDWLDKYKAYNKTWEYEEPTDVKVAPIPRTLTPKKKTELQKVAELSQKPAQRQYTQEPTKQRISDNEIADAPRSREIDPVTGGILRTLLSPAKASIEGIEQGTQTLIESGKDIAKGDVGTGLLGLLSGTVRTGFSAATPFVPVLSGFTAGQQALQETAPESVNKAIESVMSPISAITQPKTKAGQYGAELGDLVYQIALFGGISKGSKYFRNVEKTLPFPRADKPLTLQMDDMFALGTEVAKQKEVKNAVKERQVAESGIEQYQRTPEIRTTTETGGGNKLRNSGQIKQEKGQINEQDIFSGISGRGGMDRIRQMQEYDLSQSGINQYEQRNIGRGQKEIRGGYKAPISQKTELETRLAMENMLEQSRKLSGRTPTTSETKISTSGNDIRLGRNETTEGKNVGQRGAESLGRTNELVESEGGVGTNDNRTNREIVDEIAIQIAKERGVDSVVGNDREMLIKFTIRAIASGDNSIIKRFNELSKGNRIKESGKIQEEIVPVVPTKRGNQTQTNKPDIPFFTREDLIRQNEKRNIQKEIADIKTTNDALIIAEKYKDNPEAIKILEQEKIKRYAEQQRAKEEYIKDDSDANADLLSQKNTEAQVIDEALNKFEVSTPTFKSWLESQPDVELAVKKRLTVTGKGEQIGAFTQKVGDKWRVTVSETSPESSYAKEIGRVLSHKIDPEQMRGLAREYADLGFRTGTLQNDFASAVKEVLTKPDARQKAPELTRLLEQQKVPFTDISENPLGVPESITAKTRREVSSEFESPIKGTSHFKSFEKFTNDKDLNQYLEGLGHSEKSRGVLTKDIVDDLASQLGIKESDVLKTKAGEIRNVEWLRGAKQVIADNILEMDKFRKSREGQTLTKDEAKQLKKMYLTHLEMIARVKGLATETGRALQEMNRPVSAREFDVLNEIKKQLDESGEPTETVLAQMSKNEKIRMWMMEGLNLPRVALTSFDLSMPLRQGKLLLLTNPKAGMKNFAKMHKSAFSEEYFKGVEKDLANRANADLYEKTDLFLTERDPVITRQGSVEEVFYGNKLAEHAPVLGQIIKGSERGAASFMNLMRADTFDMFADKLKESGITYDRNPKLYKDLAWMIDKMSMRGDVGKLERVSGILNSIFFSIRNQTAKFQLLAAALTGRKILDPRKGQPVEYYKLDPMVRKEIMKTATKDIGFTLGALSVASLLGGQVETNPLSSDFLKLRIGNTRIDPWAGWQQYVVLGAQAGLNKKKNLNTGKITGADKFPFETRLGKLAQFTRKKLSPTASIPVDVLAGKDIMGEPVTPLGLFEKSVSPMAVSDFYDALNELGIAGTLAGLFGFYGGSTQTYKERK